jgi:hypothetical protein
VFLSPKWDQFFQLDPVFPQRLLEAKTDRIVDFLNNLVEDYSMRCLTVQTDRVTAISGLQSRIARTLGCEARHGILKRFLHRNLLWHGTQRMERIRYNDLIVPSWSWMAHPGGIRFVEIPFDFRSDVRLRFDTERKDALIGSLGKFRKCIITQEATRCVMSDYRGTERGWVQFDIDDKTDIDILRCVVVGRIDKGAEAKYFILVVQSTTTNGEYERVGVGILQSSYVSKLVDGIRII